MMFLPTGDRPERDPESDRIANHVASLRPLTHEEARKIARLLGMNRRYPNPNRRDQ